MLQLADHLRILCLICGSYTPMLIKCGCPRLLGVNWALAGVSALVKATGSRLDVIGFHIPLFMIMGWLVVSVWEHFWAHFTPWVKSQCLLTGALYSLGLLPWGINRIEGHNALWHVFVFSASAAFYSVVLLEVSRPDTWATSNATVGW